ncbi:hypothetical protein ABE562_04795 [Brucella intermedia]|uniref:Uncharacterized protein n=1 Tax=Brucella intermedia GD04153 TaxID=2975438 RepID=A0AA42H067_9HYPH|nr:hypothetical protein [Brucella intermedia]MDH0123283.1 hypothetical protein [Brucella intermedia GD04153]
MQKSADIASVATRLNNLEQKFDELPEGGESDPAVLNRIFTALVEGAQMSAVPPEKWDAYLFYDYGKSLTQMTYGDANNDWNPFMSASEVPFFDKVFSNSDWMNHSMSGGSHPTASLATKILGGRVHDPRLAALADIGLEDGTPSDGSTLSLIEATSTALNRLSAKIDKIIDQELPAIKNRLSWLESRIS